MAPPVAPLDAGSTPPRRRAGSTPRSGGRGASGWLAALGASALAGMLLAVGVWGALGVGDGAAAPGAGGSGDPLAPGARPTPASTVTSAAAGAAPPGTVLVPAGGAGGVAGPVVQVTVGQCIAVAGPADARQVLAVACDQPHWFEVAGVVDASPLFDSAPTEVEWRALLEQRCPDLMRAYVGPTYDPHGILALRVTAPTAAEWNGGDRLGECLVTAGNAEDGTPREVSAPIAKLDQSPPVAAGGCLALAAVAELPARPAPCDGAHELQVVGPFDLTERFEHYPTGEQWGALDKECRPAAVARYGEQLAAPSGNPLTALVVRVPVESWLAGRRDSMCAVGEVDPATGRLVTRTASLDG